MNNTIKILAPGKNCRKVKRIIKEINEFLIANNYKADIVFVTTVKEFVNYKTWILPTIIINDVVASRGYTPLEDDLVKMLNR